MEDKFLLYQHTTRIYAPKGWGHELSTEVSNSLEVVFETIERATDQIVKEISEDLVIIIED